MTRLDLAQLRKTAIIEFRPYANQIILWVTVALAFLTTNFSMIAVEFTSSEVNVWTTRVIFLFVVLFFIQLTGTIYFSSEKRAYRHQKAQAVFMCLFLFKAPIDVYTLYFVLCDVTNAPQFYKSFGICFLLIGVVYLIVFILLKIRGGRFKESYRIEETDGYSVVIYNRSSKTAKLLKYFLYLLFITLLDVIMNSSVDGKGYLILCLYHAIITQYVVSKKLSNGLLIALYKFKIPEFRFTNETYVNLKQEEAAGLRASGPKRIIVKPVQYILFIVYMIVGVDVVFDNVSATLIALYGVFFLLLLKWIIKYNISYPGLYVINGLLSGFSVVISLGFVTSITSRTIFNTNEAVWVFGGCICFVIFWWCFDYISFLRRNSG